MTKSIDQLRVEVNAATSRVRNAHAVWAAVDDADEAVAWAAVERAWAAKCAARKEYAAALTEKAE